MFHFGSYFNACVLKFAYSGLNIRVDDICRYMWVNLDEVDANQGLTVLLYGGLIALGIAVFSVLVTYKDKFADFIQDVAVQQVPVVGGPSGEKSE